MGPIITMIKMNYTKALTLVVTALMSLVTPALAQDNEVEASVEATLVSKYMWRGQELGGVSLQPTATVSWQGLSLTASGSTGFERADGDEIDLQLDFSYNGLCLGINDYWHTGDDAENRYMKFDRDEGPHRIEGYVGYVCRYFGLQAFTTFWGQDFKPNGDRAYSTYIEATLPFRVGGLSWQVKAGITPFESGSHKEQKEAVTFLGPETITYDSYYYADGPACVMASIRATKQLYWGDVRLPVFAEIHTNPYLQRASVLLGFSVIPF